jgi:hypothetical protein
MIVANINAFKGNILNEEKAIKETMKSRIDTLEALIRELCSDNPIDSVYKFSILEEETTLRVTSIGATPDNPVYEWKKDDVIIGNGDNVTKDNGKYTCKITVGSDEFTTEYEVTSYSARQPEQIALSLWYQLGRDIDGEAPFDRSGWSVSMSADGTKVAIGAPFNNALRGHVRVYKYDNGEWVQMGQDVDGKVTTINGEDLTTISGISVSLAGQGNRLAIGEVNLNSTQTTSVGKVRIYDYNTANQQWQQLGQDINSQDIDGNLIFNDNFGSSVSLDFLGSILAIGAPYNNNTGQVSVYSWNGSEWVLFGFREAPEVDGVFNGQTAGDNFGSSVKIQNYNSKVILAIGAPGTLNSEGKNIGSVSIYSFMIGVSNALWTQMGQTIDGEVQINDNEAGTSVSLSNDGTIVAIGAPYNDGGDSEDSDKGHVRVYNYINDQWVQIGQDIDGNYMWGTSGLSVSLSGDGKKVAVGIPNTSEGKVHIYSFEDEQWIQLGQSIIGEAFGNRSGEAISLSSDGTRIAIGSKYNNGFDSNSSERGHVRVYELQ